MTNERAESSKEHKGFVLLPKRWVVERTNAWLMHCRHLVRDYERLPETSETCLHPNQLLEILEELLKTGILLH
jgi:transposase